MDQGAHGTVAAPLVDAEAAAVSSARTRRRRPMSRRELVSGLGRAAGLAVAAALLPVVAGASGRPPLDVVVLLVLAYAVTWRSEFETATGVAVPTVLALCPMLVLLPPSWVPAAAAAGAVLGDVGRDDQRRRLVAALACTLPIVAPALVLLALEPAPTFADAPAYVAALVAWLVVDGGSMLLHQRLALGNRLATPRSVARMYRLELPLALVAFPAAVASTDARYAFLLPLGVLALGRELVVERRTRIEHAAALTSAYRGTALLLGDVLDADDPGTAFHSRGVVDVVLAVVDELGLGVEERQRAELAALLHDIGKVRVPKDVLNKPGALDDAELALIRRHPTDGEAMLAAVGGVLADVGVLVRHHHERLDGAGYPDGLAGDEIPLLSRVIGACDAYAAMVTDRPYRDALDPAQALDELARCAGSQFDPAVVAAIATVVRREPEIGRHPDAGDARRVAALLGRHAAA